MQHINSLNISVDGPWLGGSRAALGLTPNKAMTLDEAKRILGLDKGALELPSSPAPHSFIFLVPSVKLLTPELVQQRHKLLREANNEEGSLYLRLKVNNAKAREPSVSLSAMSSVPP